MREITTIEGQLTAKGIKFALVASRFNDFIVGELTKGAVDFLIRHGADANAITIIKVPGSFEIAQVTSVLAQSKKYDGIICLGALIRGATPHFDLIANETTKSLAQISLQYGVPIGFGVLTTDNLEQAIERAGTKSGNKGADAASACLEVIQVMRQLKK
jgi:6,7-dimethyl-8-ribityllumazine synthase